MIREHCFVYHFHDTSREAAAKQYQDIHNVTESTGLLPRGENLAAFLYSIRNTQAFNAIENAVKDVFKQFGGFVLEPNIQNPDKILLRWHERTEPDFTFGPNALSDGTLRFICLATLFLQPKLPSVIIIDEPELGLHPYAIYILAALMREASAKGCQVIVSTQSVTLLNHFGPEEIIVAERSAEGATTFKQFNTPEKVAELEAWLEDYAMGEIWEKNLIGGRP